MMNNLLNFTLIAVFSFVLLLVVTNHVTQAGPLHHSISTKEKEQQTLQNTDAAIAQMAHRRIHKREIYPEIMDDQPSSSAEKVPEEQSPVCVVGDLVYEMDEAVPAEQPCLKCRCQPPGVHCEATRCEKKPGCRAIHKPNACCPEYQCECDYEGRTYANGERLEQKPGTECKVCYCRGGEVQCAEVSCYIRNDCEGRHVPGKCCPKYDHCPPKEPSNIFFANEININETSKNDQPQEITIQEIIPEIKEFPITSSPKREIQKVSQSSEEITKTETETTKVDHQDENNHENHVIADSDIEGSELTEVYQQPPSVLRIGDKLLFLKKGGELVPEKGVSTPSTVITIIGAEGLQRGGVEMEESLENHESNCTTVTEPEPEGKDDLLLNDQDQGQDQDEDDIQTVAESTYILSLVNRPITTTTTESIPVSESTYNFEDNNNSTTTTAILNSSSDNFYSTEFRDEFNVTDEFGELDEGLFTEFGTESSDLVTPEDVSTTQINIGNGTTTMVVPQVEKEEVEVNPEYPPIPDVMTQQIEETEVQISPVTEPNLQIQNQNENSTENSNSNSSSNSAEELVIPWLEKTLINPKATLPESILSSVAESDLETTTEVSTSSEYPISSSTETETETEPTTNSKNSEIFSTTSEISSTSKISSTSETPELTTETSRSKETLESLEEQSSSDEKVTQLYDHASILDDSINASVESIGKQDGVKMDSDGSTTAELVEMLPGYENITAESVEVPIPDPPEIKNPQDVELVDVDIMRGHHSDEEAKNVTHEGILPTKLIEQIQNQDQNQGIDKEKKDKRQSNDDEAIFQELHREIALESGTLMEESSKEHEEKEAKEIFEELLNEATSNTTPKPVDIRGINTPQTREQHQQAVALAKIGDALAKFQLRDSKKGAGPVDANVLGILRDFFTAQYRAYN